MVHLEIEYSYVILCLFPYNVKKHILNFVEKESFQEEKVKQIVKFPFSQKISFIVGFMWQLKFDVEDDITISCLST